MTMRVTRAEFLGLEPCPHCGGEAEFDWIMGVPSLRVIRCECGAMITMGNVTDAFDGELAELWNNRVVVELEGKLRESREYAEDLSGACELLDGVNEELREQVDELTAERDVMKRYIDRKETIHGLKKLREENEKLKAERDEYERYAKMNRAECDRWMGRVSELVEERDKLKERNERQMHTIESYAKKASILQHALNTVKEAVDGL